MFGTISFERNGQYKTSKDHSFTRDENGRSIRRFACRTCRLHKVKCSSDIAPCDRCKSLKIRCVYDKPGENRPRRRNSGLSKSNSRVATMESSWTTNNPMQLQYPPQDTGSQERVEDGAEYGKGGEQSVGQPASASLADIVPGRGAEKQRLEMQRLSSKETTDLEPSDPGLSPPQGLTPNQVLLFDAHNLSELNNPDWSLMDEHSHPYASPERSSPHRATDTMRPTLPTPPRTELPSNSPRVLASRQSNLCSMTSEESFGTCSCSNQLSRALFVLNGKARRLAQDDSLESFSRVEVIHRILLEHTQMLSIDEDVNSCIFGCWSKKDNHMLIAMVVEQFADLYSSLVHDFISGSDVAQKSTGIAVHIGGYAVEGPAERQAILCALLSERLKSLISFSASWRDRLAHVAGSSDIRARLQASIQSLELLKNTTM